MEPEILIMVKERNQREGLKGKTAKEVDPLYQAFAERRAPIEEGVDFNELAYQLVYARDPDYRYGVSIDIDPQVLKLLNEHRPETLFFDPRDILTYLPGENIIGEHKPKIRSTPHGSIETYNHEEWVFGIDPRKLQRGERAGGYVVLTQSDTPHLDRNPLLILLFIANYDEEKQVLKFTPSFSMTEDGGDISEKPLEKGLFKLMGIKSIPEIHCPLKFEVIEIDEEMTNGTTEKRLAVRVSPKEEVVTS
jgi:hypothetical protein